MGSAWMYDCVRPWALGGFDFSEAYAWLKAQDEDVIIDVGCGTGYALKFVDSFKAYHGFDVDATALAIHKKKYTKENTHLYPRRLQIKDVQEIRPTKGIMMGLLHHLSDSEVLDLLKCMNFGGTITRAITLDVVYQNGRWMNNLLARLDRGRYPRSEEGYRALIAQSPFTIETHKYICCGNRLATYWASCLVPHSLPTTRR
jgi:SAM-dependent methyltransferase